MKRMVFLIMAILFIFGMYGDEKINQDWYSKAIKHIEESEYYIKPNKDGQLQSPNRVNNLRIYYYDNGFEIVPRVEDSVIGKWSIKMIVKDFDKDSVKIDKNTMFIYGKYKASGGFWNKLFNRKKSLIIKYENSKKGFKDSYTMQSKRLPIILKTDLDYKISKNGIVFTKNKKRILNYSGLTIKDKNGNKIDGYFEKKEYGFDFVIKGKCTFPVYIDPLFNINLFDL